VIIVIGILALIKDFRTEFTLQFPLFVMQRVQMSFDGKLIRENGFTTCNWASKDISTVPMLVEI